MPEPYTGRDSHLLTVEQVAEEFGLAPRSVRALVTKQRIPVVRLGRANRIQRGAMRDYIAAATTPARAA